MSDVRNPKLHRSSQIKVELMSDRLSLLFRSAHDNLSTMQTPTDFADLTFLLGYQP